MRVVYAPKDERIWDQYYQRGGSLGFSGIPYQRGYGLGSFFKGIFRSILPVAKSALKTVGKQALHTGAEIVSDVAAGQSFKQSAKKRAKAGTARLVKKAATKLQEGRGLGVRQTKRPAATCIPKSIKGRAKRKKTLVKKVDLFGNYYDG